jgi:subtilisin family serine protease
MAGDQKRGSNFGLRRVHIGAIGENFTTGLKDNVSTYGLTRGTSNAGPVVAGVAALIYSVCPDLSPKQVKEIIIESATPVNSLRGKIESGGVVDAYNAVKTALQFK